MPNVEKSPSEDALAPPPDPAIRYASRNVKHTRYGIWDMYEEDNPDAGKVTMLARLKEKWEDVTDGLPEVVLALKDALTIPGCKLYISTFAAAELVASFIPAVSIWCGPSQCFSPPLPHHTFPV